MGHTERILQRAYLPTHFYGTADLAGVLVAFTIPSKPTARHTKSPDRRPTCNVSLRSQQGMSPERLESPIIRVRTESSVTSKCCAMQPF